MKIGVMFGNPEETTGGKALKFYSSVRIDIRRRAQIKMGERIIGNRVTAKVVKNKVAAPFKVGEFDIMYNEGINAEADIVDLGVRYGLIKKAGSWLSYNDAKLGQGREASKAALKLDKNLAKELRTKIWAAAEAEENSGEIPVADEPAPTVQ
jgi:recombination protein RecA